MPENKHLRFLLYLVYVILAAAGIWLFLTVLLPWVLPFLLALLFAWLLEPVVAFLGEKARLRRPLAAALCTLTLALLLCAVLGLAAWRAGYEVTLLLGRLPALLSALPALGEALEDAVYRFTVALPVQFQEFFRSALGGLVSQGVAIPAQFYDWLVGAVARLAAGLPDGILFFFTTALATYFSSATRPALLRLLQKPCPPRWRGKLAQSGSILRSGLGGWLKAQATLMLLTFFVLGAGFLFLQIDLALLLAALVALVDALPIFGTGTVLVPWALVALCSGDWKLALGLALLLAAVSVVRSLLEPRIVGKQTGLPPLAALFAMYVGFRAFGIWGMILSPLLAVLLKQLWDSGLFRGHTSDSPPS